MRTQTPAIPSHPNNTNTNREFFHGLEDQVTAGTLVGDGVVNLANATFTLVPGSATNGAVTLDPATGAFVFTPNANYFGPTDFVGPATFRYTVSDGVHTSAVRTAYIYIGGINDAPVASTQDEAMEIAAGEAFTYGLRLGSDVDHDERLTYHLVGGSETNGTVTIDPSNGRYVFTPADGFSGQATFSYYVSDGQLDSAPKTVTLTVLADGEPAVRLTYNQAVDLLIAGDFQGFVRNIILLADRGDVGGAYFYGTWLRNGQNVPMDTALAAHYLEMVRQIPDAALMLADMYVSGEGVARDYAEARELYESLPNNGTALYRLAILHDNGYGGPVDDAGAVALYVKAAELGNADAMYTLGRRYLSGEGVAVSAADAYFWLGVGLKLNGGPAVGAFDQLLVFNMQQAVTLGLTAGQKAALDAAIAGWTPGQSVPVNDAPTPGDESAVHAGSTNQPVLGTLAHATDVDGESPRYVLVAGSALHGTVTINADTGAFVFTPANGYFGPASFRYYVTDGQANSAEVEVAFEIELGTAALADGAAVNETGGLTATASAGLLVNDTVSADGASLVVSSVNGSAGNVGQTIAGTYGDITVNADGSYSFQAYASTAALTQGQTAVETITYAVTDGLGVTSTSTLTITVNGQGGTILNGSGVLIGSQFGDLITGGTGSDVILGQGGDDVIDGGSGGANEIYGGAGNDTFILSAVGDTVIELANEGTDTVRTSLNTFILGQNIENLTFTGSGDLTATGNASNNVFVVGTGANVIDGAGGVDTVDYGSATGGLTVKLANGSAVKGGGVNDVLTSIENVIGSAFNDTLVGTSGANRLEGGLGSDYLIGGAGDDILVGGAGLANAMQGGTGNDLYIMTAAGDSLNEFAGEGVDSVQTSLTAYSLRANFENLTYTGSAAFTGYGNNENNIIISGAGNDTLRSGGGSDTLNAGGGVDTVDYSDATAAVSVNLRSHSASKSAGGADVLIGFENITGSAYADVLISDHGGSVLNGGLGSDYLIGGNGADVLIGGAGQANAMQGGAGNDRYIVSVVGDSLSEFAGEGVDTVETTLSQYTLRDNFENLVFTGSGAFSGVGNSANNQLTGGAFNDILRGGGGSDILNGGGGADTADYATATAGVTVNIRTQSATKSAGGSDTLVSIENVTGSAFNDTLIGGAGFNSLNGGAGNDTVDYSAAAGAVTVKLAGSLASADGDGATDLLISIENVTGSAFNDLLFGDAQNNVLSGGAGSDTLLGQAGDDVLIGGAGAANIMQGGLGDDRYVVTAVGDTLTEFAGQGIDTVETSLAAYTLRDYFEKLTYIGSGNFTGLGNAADNVITGGLGADTLKGAAGNDVLVGGDGAANLLQGGTGDDRYVVTAAGDTVTELAGEGTDTIQTTLAAWTLQNHVENLTYIGSGAFSGTGNALANVITGGGHADVLNGGDGADTLVGGAGDDVLTGGDGAANILQGGTGDDRYIVTAAGDTVTELSGEGTDVVETTLASWTLQNNVENLTYTGVGAFAGTGNGLDNIITGGAGGDTLIGAGGNDVLIGGDGAANVLQGGTGDDRYVVTTAGDTVTELSGEGVDTVETNLSTWTLQDHVENLTYTGSGAFTGSGNALGNVITGGGNADALDGGEGADTLVGGAGDDVLTGGDGAANVLQGGTGDDRYVVTAAGDTVTELADEGVDLIETTLSAWTLQANVENLTYTGGGDFTGTGNALDNVITGGAHADALNGGEGADTLVGGAGDDVLTGGDGASNILQGGTGADRYVVTAAGDIVTELADEGVDVIETNLTTWTLQDHVENLTYTGSGAFTGSGNGLDNVITGGGDADLLDGGEGADTLIGAVGDDVLTGGAGAANILQGGTGDDRYVVTAAGDTVTELADEGVDLVETTLSAWTLQANVENLTYTGAGDFAGTGNELDNVVTGGDGSDTLSGAAGNDVLIGGAGAANVLQGGVGDDRYVVTAEGDTVTELADEGLDVIETNLSTWTLQDHVENLTYTGSGAFTGSGNALDNVITGGGEADLLDGGEGADTLIGAAGDDVLTGGAGAANVLQGGTGDDRYVVAAEGDTVTELADEGVDVVETTLSAWTLQANVENLTYTGSGDFAGTGNELDNVVTGGDGSDTLNGAAGNDVLIGGAGAANVLQGGAGDDRYVVTAEGDTVTELADEGVDQVETTLAAYVLGDNLETLAFVGAGAFEGTGNALDNVITGGAANDTLSGGAGNDALNGGDGEDTALLSGAQASYTVTLNEDGSVTVVDTAAGEDGDDGTDILNGMEFLHFGDGSVLDLSTLSPPGAPLQGPDAKTFATAFTAPAAQDDAAVALTFESLGQRAADPDLSGKFMGLFDHQLTLSFDGVSPTFGHEPVDQDPDWFF
ncbi:Ig-like domain-containing protein [Brevundimonas alba]|uniref:Ig-like domain-containing protein n=1 Tax=Brevundimonas alba TaxID=74314 RepID=UPI003CC91101